MKRFLTEWEGEGGELLSDTVDAESWTAAQEKCDQGQRGEKVIGEIEATIHVDDEDETLLDLDDADFDAEADAWHSQYD